MTYFTAALDAGQRTKLRGTGAVDRSYRCNQLVFLCPNAPVFNARVNGAVTGQPTLSINYDNVTFGATTDIKIGQRIIISPTNDRMDRNAITGRILDTPTGTTSGIIYLNEISDDIADDSYIFVVNTYDLRDRLAKIVQTDPIYVQAKDGILSYEPLPPLVAGTQMSYVQRVDSITGKASFSLDASASYATDDTVYAANTLDFLWEFDNSGAVTVTGGGTTEDNIAFDVDEGFQWAHLTITDLNGTATVFHYQVHPWGDIYTPVLGFDGASISADIQNGYGVSAVAFTAVNTVLDNTWMTIVRSPEYYNGVAGQLIDGDPYYVDFVGFLSTESSTGKSDELYSFLPEVSFEVTGIGQRLAQIEMQAIGIRNQDSPTVWDYIAQLMPWRAIVHIWARHSTAATLVPLQFTPDVINTSYFYPYFNTPLGGNLLSSINYILNGINAALEFWPNGTAEAVRDIRYVTELNRLGYLTLLDLIISDFYDIAIAWQHIPPTGKVYAEGALFNANSGQVVACKSIAPGTAQQIGSNTGTLGQQILTEAGSQAEGQAELNQRAGNYFAILNDDGNTVTLSVPGGYDAIFYPSRNVLYTLTYDDTVRGITYTTDTKFMCIGKSSQHNNEAGSRDSVQITLQRLIPFAAPGDAIPQIADGDIAPAIPDLPPFPAFSDELPEFSFPLDGLALGDVNPAALSNPPGQAAKKDGSVLIVKSQDQAYLLNNAIILTTPQANEVTPSDLETDFELQQALFDPLNTGSNKLTANRYAYLLESDGTNSHVQRTANIWGKPPVWLTGDDIDGLYNVLRGTNVDGGLMVYSPGDEATPWTYTHDFTVNNGGWTASGGVSQYSPGVGWVNGVGQGGCNILYTFPANATLLSISFTYTASGIVPPYNTLGWGGAFGAPDETTSNGTHTPSVSGLDPSDSFVNFAAYTDQPDAGGGGTGSMTISHVTVTGRGYNPFTNSGGGGNALVRYSSDRTGSFGSELTIGASIPVGGFDVSRASGVSYAAAGGKVYRATTLGGAYSAYYTITGGAEAVCIIVPYFNYAGAKQTSATNPDIIIALNQLDGSSRSLLWIEGGATPGSVHNITPVAGIIFESANCITSQYNTNLAVIGLVSGNRRCYTSTNIGASWTLRLSSLSSNAQFIRTRRGDTRAKDGGNAGQLYLIDGSTLHYSPTWGVSFGSRALPVACNGLDILG